MPLSPKQYDFVPANGRWCSSTGKVTAGLTESNGGLSPGGWLRVTCGLAACTRGSSVDPSLSNKYGRTFNYMHLLSRWKNLAKHCSKCINEWNRYCSKFFICWIFLVIFTLFKYLTWICAVVKLIRLIIKLHIMPKSSKRIHVIYGNRKLFCQCRYLAVTVRWCLFENNRCIYKSFLSYEIYLQSFFRKIILTMAELT